MALPIILINSATGSDTLASGAGPSTALTGTAASTSGDGLTVTLDGSPDLTNVATDGSHVIYLADSTAGNRNFGKITAKDNGAKTVTVSDAFGISLSALSWAIGGKRATIGGTNSKKLFDNNGAAGDAMPGWIVEMESGHIETITAEYRLMRAGDTTSGPIVLQGTVGAATKPVITFSNDSNCFVLNAIMQRLIDFTILNNNASKTASIAIVPNFSSYIIQRMTIGSVGNNFWKGIKSTDISGQAIIGCEIGWCVNDGLEFGSGGGNTGGIRVFGNYIHDNVRGIEFTSGPWFSIYVQDNIVESNSSDGLYYDNSRDDQLGGIHIDGNIFYNNSGDGIEIVTAVVSIRNTIIQNNIFKSNGAYGLNFSSGSFTASYLSGAGVLVQNNVFHGNTSGKYNPSGLTSLNELTVDPNFVDASNGNFTPQESTLKGTAFPTTINSITNYGWIGAIQPNSTSGSNIIQTIFQSFIQKANN